MKFKMVIFCLRWKRTSIWSDLQQKMLSVTGVSLSVTLLATQVPILVLLSAPITTPPSNSRATRVVPVDTSSHPGNQSLGKLSLHIPGKFCREATVAMVSSYNLYLKWSALNISIFLTSDNTASHFKSLSSAEAACCLPAVLVITWESQNRTHTTSHNGILE